MSRPALLNGLLLFLLTAPVGRAQDSERPEPPPNPLDAKELAKAKFALSHQTDQKTLAQAKLDAARRGAEARYLEFFAGRGTLLFMLASAMRLLESECDSNSDEAHRLAALERHWTLVQALHVTNKARFYAGRIPIGDYGRTVDYRMEGERLFAEALAKSPKAATRLPALLQHGSGVWDELTDPVQQRDLARAKLGVRQRSLAELSNIRLDAAHVVLVTRYREFLAGRGGILWVGTAAERVLQAELASSADEPERVAARERAWVVFQNIEDIYQPRYEHGRIPVQDLAWSRSARMRTQRLWLEARPPREQGAPRYWKYFTDEFGIYPWWGIEEVYPSDLLRPECLPKAREQALRTTPDELAKTEMEEARIDYDAREHEFLRGRGTLALILDSSERLRDAELRVCQKAPDRHAVLERHWARVKLIDHVTHMRYNSGRVPIEDHMDARYYRLDAELALLKLRVQEPK